MNGEPSPQFPSLMFSPQASALSKRTAFFCSCLIALLLPCCIAGAQERSLISVVIAGNTAISTDEIMQWFRADTIRVWDEHVPAVLAHEIRQRYAERGFPFCSVDSISFQSVSSGTSEIRIALTEGKRALIGTVVVEEADGTRKSAMVEDGMVFSPSSLEITIERILGEYEAAGFPFAEVGVKDIRFAWGGDIMNTHVTLSADRRAKLLVKQVKVEGNSLTRDEVIVRELRLGEGVLFQTGLLERAQRRIERLQLFSKVYPPELFVGEDHTGGILIRVEEGKHNRFDGVVGYTPAARQNERGVVMGLADVELRNLFGTARRLSVRWHREDRLSQEIGIRYYEPWVASYPVNAEIGLHQRRQDSTYVRQSVDMRADMRIGESVSLGASFSETDVYPGERQLSVRRARLIAFGGSLSVDSRDNTLAPTEGALYATEVQIGVKRIEARPTERTRRIAVDVEYYVSPLRRQILAAMLHMREFRSASLQVSELYRLGGATTLRGYRESQFLGSRLAWVNLEYRFLTGARSFAYGFIDAGYIFQHGPSGGSSDLRKVGYGVGIRLETGVGLIGVSLALGEGDTFSTAKLHFRLVNEF